jgi:ABC-type multidrug transport system ATPase subunit
MATIAQVRRLTKSYGALKAVDDLSFSVEEGDVYGFLGQNGAGKSTTLRMLLSLVYPTNGDIELLGLSLSSHRKEILKQVGAVIENPELYPYFSGLENLSLFARLSGMRPNRKQLMEQLSLVGLAERAKDKVQTYSMGMKQRLGIAVALVSDPALIILDEPTNGLDPQGIADIRHLILHLSRDRNKTLIVSSHLLAEMQIIAYRMLIMDKGKKVVEGEMSTLLDPSQTLVYLDSTDNEASRLLLENSSWGPALRSGKDHAPLQLQMNKVDIPRFNEDLVSMGIGVISLQPRHSLEDYFLQLTTPV